MAKPALPRLCCDARQRPACVVRSQGCCGYGDEGQSSFLEGPKVIPSSSEQAENNVGHKIY